MSLGGGNGPERRRMEQRGASGRPRIENLRRRAQILAALRRALDDRGYVEVQVPVLVRAAGTDPHIEPIPVAGYGYLSTSPEFQLKRLLVGGMERIYSIGPAFRSGERGPAHDIEFTMAEWYAVGIGYRRLAEETAEVLAQVAQEVLGTTLVSSRHGIVDLRPPWDWVTVRQAFVRHAGMDVSDDVDAFAAAARAVGVLLPDDATWDEVFFRVFVERVEPFLGQNRPTLLADWPVALAALSRIRHSTDSKTDSKNSAVAERFEVYAGGLELANAFGELTDPAEQRRRFEADNLARSSSGAPRIEPDERFLAALEEGMPEASGIAMGVDRLSMLLTGARTIREVTTFTSEEL